MLIREQISKAYVIKENNFLALAPSMSALSILGCYIL